MIWKLSVSLSKTLIKKRRHTDDIPLKTIDFIGFFQILKSQSNWILADDTQTTCLLKLWKVKCIIPDYFSFMSLQCFKKQLCLKILCLIAFFYFILQNLKINFKSSVSFYREIVTEMFFFGRLNLVSCEREIAIK